jgi:hypothetical protein
MTLEAPLPLAAEETGFLIMATIDVELDHLDREHAAVAAALALEHRRALQAFQPSSVCSLADVTGPGAARHVASRSARLLAEQMQRIDRQCRDLAERRDELLGIC